MPKFQSLGHPSVPGRSPLWTVGPGKRQRFKSTTSYKITKHRSEEDFEHSSHPLAEPKAKHRLQTSTQTTQFCSKKKPPGPICRFSCLDLAGPLFTGARCNTRSAPAFTRHPAVPSVPRGLPRAHCGPSLRRRFVGALASRRRRPFSRSAASEQRLGAIRGVESERVGVRRPGGGLEVFGGHVKGSSWTWIERGLLEKETMHVLFLQSPKTRNTCSKCSRSGTVFDGFDSKNTPNNNAGMRFRLLRFCQNHRQCVKHVSCNTQRHRQY